MLDTESKPPAKLVPVTNTRPPPGLTATELATLESLPGPLNRRAHSFAPGTASAWAVASACVLASDCALAGCGARVAAPAALAQVTPKVPTTAPAATTAAARLINLPMADLPCADHHGWLPAPPGSHSPRRRCVTSRLPPQPGRTHIDAPLMGPDYRICGIVRTSSRLPVRVLSGLANIGCCGPRRPRRLTPQSWLTRRVAGGLTNGRLRQSGLTTR